MTIERVVLRLGSVILIANLAALVVFGALRDSKLAIDVALLQITLSVLITAGLHPAYALARRVRSTREVPDFRIAIADGHLRMYEPGRHGTQLVDADLTTVRHIHWYVSAFSRQQTVRITLWDRPSTFTLQGHRRVRRRSRRTNPWLVPWPRPAPSNRPAPAVHRAFRTFGTQRTSHEHDRPSEPPPRPVQRRSHCPQMDCLRGQAHLLATRGRDRASRSLRVTTVPHQAGCGIALLGPSALP